MQFGRRTDQVRKQRTYQIDLPDEVTPAADALFRKKLTTLVLKPGFRIPPIPGVVAELIRLSGNTTKLTDSVMALIERDAALAGELLVRARTASIGPGKPLLDLPKAIRRMGPRRLIHWLLELSQGEVFRSKLLHDMMKEQYRHNFSVACASAHLFQVLRLDSKKGFLCGLLHDIGHHAVLSGLASMGRTQSELLTPQGVRQAMMMHHGQIGAMVISMWKLPKLFAEVARYHDRPDRATLFKPVVNAVAVANAADKIRAEDVRERTEMLMRVKLCYRIGLGKPEIRELAAVVEKARTERYLNALLDQG